MSHKYTHLLWVPCLALLVLAGCDQASMPTSADEDASARVSPVPDAGDLAGGDLAGTAGKRDVDLVPGQYIVVFNRGAGNAPELARQLAGQAGGSLQHVYQHALQGFSVSNLSENAAAALERNPNVAYVQQDRTAQIYAQETPTGVRRIFADANPNLDIDGTDDARVDVDVAIIDTGIDFEHPDLNVVGGVNCASGGPFGGSCKSGGDDDHYHGTHVAGTVAALDNGSGVVGVAPGARLHAVKVLDSRGSGYTSWIVAGIDWVAANASTIEVANMSLGGSGYSQAEYDAIQGAVNKGVAFAVAAGNSDDDANNYSPAAFDNVLTVSALADFDGAADGNGSPTCRTDQDDTLADFSNWGSAVQIAAPGVCIRSTYPIEQGEYGTISGTSMASPHAAGALALLASSDNPDNATDVQNLYNQVINADNVNWTDDSGDGIKEPLLDVRTFTATMTSGSGGGGTTDNPPSVSITNPTDGATVSGTVLVTADATDDNGVSQVEFFVDGSSIGVDGDGSNGWSIDWNTTASSDGSHALTARATDTASQTTTSSQISVTVDNASGITLSANGYKEKGQQKANMNWSGATSANVDVYRKGEKITTTANDGAYTDNINQRGGGSYDYQVCEAGSTLTCSNVATVTF